MFSRKGYIMKRKGSAIATALILGTVFFIAVSALLQHSSGEMKHVKAISAVKKAELLAMSGIDWAESELRKGRWYGSELKEYKNTIGEHRSFGKMRLSEDLNLIPDGEGEVTVICEDVANKTPGSNNYGMQKIWYLHHINVYALGEFENQKCLVYGRYIISPEPPLNSKLTDIYDTQENSEQPGLISVSIPTTSSGNQDVTEYTIKELKAYEGKYVDVNTVLALIHPIGEPDKIIKVRPQDFGNVYEVKMQEGQNCSAGEKLLTLSKSINTSEGSASMKSLKKMVRVTKIPLDVWEGLDIENINDRFAISQYISGLSDSFLQNFVAHARLEESIKGLGVEKLDKKISSSDVLTKFPADFTSTTRNRAENTFLAYMIKNFTAPGENWEEKEKALKKTFLQLDQPKSTQPPKEYMDWLNELGYPEIIKTKPRVDPRYFDPKLKNDEFMTLLNPHLNQPPEQFIQTLSQLQDAARNIDIKEGEYESSENKYDEDENSIEIVDSNKGIKINVAKETKKYTFVDPESNFAIEMQDLMNFIQKYYSDDNCVSPREDVRINEFVDWPLPEPPGEPPAPLDGGNWVWQPGKPGVPPGDPTYDHSGGSDVDINPPTGGTGSYEPYYPGDPDGGKKDWDIPGSPYQDGGDNGNKPEKDEDEKENSSIKNHSCSGGCCGICNGDNDKVKEVMNKNTTWTVTPGTPGKDPEQGRYIWVPKQESEDDGDDGDDGDEGDASGTSTSNDDESGGTSGSGGSSGSGTGSPGGSSGGGSGASTPSRSYRSGSFGC